MTIGATVLAATFVLGGGAAAAGALTSGGSPAVAQQPAAATAPATPSASASPSPKATPSGSSGTHNGPTYNGPVTIINQAPQPGSTVYVPVPSSAPAYFTSNQDVVQEYYAYLNCGYRLPLVGGTDKMTADVPVGVYRTYANLGQEEFSYRAWASSVRAGDRSCQQRGR